MQKRKCDGCREARGLPRAPVTAEGGLYVRIDPRAQAEHVLKSGAPLDRWLEPPCRRCGARLLLTADQLLDVIHDLGWPAGGLPFLCTRCEAVVEAEDRARCAEALEGEEGPP
jgi:hypothetical protein